MHSHRINKDKGIKKEIVERDKSREDTKEESSLLDKLIKEYNLENVFK